MAIKMVKVAEVTPGCVLGASVLSGNGKILLDKDAALTTRGISLLNAWDVKCVYIHSEEGQINLPLMASVKKTSPEDNEKIFLEYNSIVTNMVQSFDFIRKEKIVPVAHFKDAAGSIYSSIVNNVVAVTNKLLVSDYGVADYISRHSVMVAFLAGIIACRMKWKTEDIRGVALAGLLHEVGTLLAGKAEASQQRPQAYIAEAVALLKESRGITGEVILGVVQHRECIDGSGFPTGVNGLEIHPYAKVIAVADAFHSQAYVGEYSNPFPVLDRLAKEMFGKLDPAVCHTFIKQVRDSLLHNKILLSDGREAEVIFFNPTGSSLPVIKTADYQIVDLAKHGNLAIAQIIAQN